MAWCHRQQAITCANANPALRRYIARLGLGEFNYVYQLRLIRAHLG